MVELTFRERLKRGLVSKPESKDDYVEVDLHDYARLNRRPSVGLITPKNGKRLAANVDKVCYPWARVYNSTCKREIEKETGSLKKPADIGSGAFAEDQQYIYVWSIINSLNSYPRMMMVRHYLEKREHMTTKEFCRKIDVNPRTYRRHLREARDLFVSLGGIQ